MRAASSLSVHGFGSYSFFFTAYIQRGPHLTVGISNETVGIGLLDVEGGNGGAQRPGAISSVFAAAKEALAGCIALAGRKLLFLVRREAAKSSQVGLRVAWR